MTPPELRAIYSRLLEQGGGTPTGAMLQSDINRGVVPGNPTPGGESMSPSDLASVDRYAWGRQGGLGGLPVAAIYELLKKVSQSGASGVLPAVASAAGFEDTASQFQQDKTSSPASLKNVATYGRGALDALLEKLR